MLYPFDSSEKFMCVQLSGNLDLTEVISWFRMRLRSKAGSEMPQVMEMPLVWGLHSEYAGNRQQ